MKSVWLVLLFSVFQITTLIGQDKVPKSIWNMGDSIENNVKSLDGSYLNHLFNPELILKYVLQQADGDKRIEDFNTGFSMSIRKSTGFGDRMVGSVKLGRAFDFLHPYLDADGDYHLIFRIFDPSKSAINYLDMTLIEEEDGWYVGEIYNFISGEGLLQAAKKIYADGLIELLNKEMDSEYLEGMAKAKTMGEFTNTNKYEKALEVYHSLPKKVQQEKAVQVYYLMATSNTSEKEHAKAIKNYKKLFPKDPSLDLLLLSSYMRKKQYKKCLAAIDRLDDHVLGDQFLDYFRGNIHVYMKELEEAKSYYKQVLSNFTKFELVLAQLIYVHHELGEYQNLLENLDYYIETIGATKPAMITYMTKHYSEFSKSEEFEAWKAQD